MTAKIITNGSSQDVHLPCVPLDAAWDIFRASLDEFSDDFMSQGRPEETDSPRESL